MCCDLSLEDNTHRVILNLQHNVCFDLVRIYKKGKTGAAPRPFCA